MIIAEEGNTHETTETIDLKCAEKVTDSDAEENVDADDTKTSKSAGNTSKTSNTATELTCKPKAIKAQLQSTDNILPTHKQSPMFAFNSPKNPTGILPFQPTGKILPFAFYM